VAEDLTIKKPSHRVFGLRHNASSLILPFMKTVPNCPSTPPHQHLHTIYRSPVTNTMNLFGKSAANDGPVVPAANDIKSTIGSGSEQDRLESHLGGTGDTIADKVKSAWNSAPNANDGKVVPAPNDIASKIGSGAEQDRLESHFGGTGGTIVDKVKSAWNSAPNANDGKVVPAPNDIASKVGSGAEQERLGDHFAVGDSVLDKLKQAVGAKGEGAEQERYGQHFDVEQEKIKAAGDSALDRLKQAANAKGEGAEQDRYGAHFSVPSAEQEKVKAAAERLIAAKGAGAEQDTHGSHFGGITSGLGGLGSTDTGIKTQLQTGLGADGLARAQQLAGGGAGAEQARDQCL
jgi:hypothetical protein